MRQQMQEAVARANRDSAAAAERSLQQEKEAAAAREVFESKLTRECEVLITQYKDMAQRAMRKAAEAQEAARLEIMSKLQEQQEGRRKWEAELQSRTTQAVQAANERVRTFPGYIVLLLFLRCAVLLFCYLVVARCVFVLLLHRFAVAWWRGLHACGLMLFVCCFPS